MSVRDIPLAIWILLHPKYNIGKCRQALRWLAISITSNYTTMFRIAFIIAALCIFGLIVNVLIIQIDNYFNQKKQTKK